MNYHEDDEFLFDMISESNEEVRDSLYERYIPLIKYLTKKYVRSAQKYGLDYNDLIQEANVGFADALNSYDEQKDASLKTFITLCIERRLINAIRKAQSNKSQQDKSNLSLEYDYDNNGQPLIEVLRDDTMDPLLHFSEQESEEALYKKIENELAEGEYTVFTYLLNGLNYKEIALLLDKTEKQIDNTIQRIRNKIRNLLKEEEKWPEENGKK